MNDGSVLISDYRNYRIAHFSKDGTFLGNFAENPGSAPYGMGVDPRNGDVYLADTDKGRIRKFDPTGKPLLAWGGLGSGVGKFLYPSRVAVASDGRVYVADTWADEIVVHDQLGRELFAFGGAGKADGQLQDPHGMAFDGQDRLFVVDTLNFRIQVFDTSGNFLFKFGSKGTGPGQFSGDLRGLAIDKTNGWVYVVDAVGNRIHKFDLGGTHLLSWGGTGSGPGQFIDGGREATVDGDGNLWVGDMPNYRAQKFSPQGEFLLEVPDPPSAPPDGGFNGPRGVAVDGDGNVFVTDTYNQRVQKFDRTGAFVGKWGVRGQGSYSFNYPRLLATDPRDGAVVVADTDNHLIKKFTNSGEFLWQSGGLGGGLGKFRNPQGIDVDPNGVIYVTDSNNHRIQVLDQNGTFLRTFGSRGTADGQFIVPRGIAVDPDGTLWVSDTNDVVTHLSSDGTYLGEVGAPGTAEHQLTSPFDVESDGRYVYVADSASGRVKVWKPDGTFVMVVGASDTHPMSSPMGLDLGPDGTLYVTELNTERVTEWLIATPTGALPSSTAIAPEVSNSTLLTIGYKALPGDAGVEEVELWVMPPGGSAFALVGTDLTTDTPSFTYSATGGDGAYRFYTRAKDALGNYEAAPAQEDSSTLVDTAVPTAPLITSGPVSPGNDRFPSWDFRGEERATMECALFRASIVVEGFAPCFGSKMYDLTGRPDASYKFLVRQTDSAGNTSPASSRFYRLDTVLPTSKATASSNETSASFNIAFAASDVGVGVRKVELWVRDPGATDYRLVSTDTTIESPSFEYSATAGDGTYSFYTRALDKAGNYEDAPAAPDTVVVGDFTAPVSSAQPPTIIDPSTVRIPFVASDNGTGVEEVEVWVKGPGATDYRLAGIDMSMESPSFDYSATAGDGTYSFFTRARDQVGNYEAAPSAADTSIVVDTVPPDPPRVLSGPPSPGNNSFPTWTFEGEAGGTFQCSLRLGAAVVKSFAPCSASRTYDLTQAADGVYTFMVRQIDGAGNQGAATSVDYRLDRSLPSSAASSPLTTRWETNVTYTFSDVGSGVTEVELWARAPNSLVFQMVAVDGSPDSNSFVYASSVKGMHYFFTRARDAAGNYETAPSSPDSSTRFK